ncbi:MAG: hypothetical protein ABW145_08080, partial [Candidatus Thiodiazotropha sp.]
RDLSGKPVGFKTVVGTHIWLEEMCEKIHQCGIACAPDFITIDGGDGGTDATDGQCRAEYQGGFAESRRYPSTIRPA